MARQIVVNSENKSIDITVEARNNIEVTLSRAVISGAGGVVTNIIAGNNISVSSSTGNVTVSTTNDITANAFYGNLVGNVVGNIVVPGVQWDVLYNNNGNAGASSNLKFDANVNVLTVVGNVVANYFVGNGSTITYITGSNVVGNVSSAVQSHYANIANSVAGANVSGAVAYATTANAVAGANVSGAVAYATTANAVAGANVSGEVTYAATANAVAGANVSGQVGNALIAGTVYTNAQPNITSVGTLTDVSISGNVTAGNVKSNNLLYANGAPYVFTANAAGSNTQVQFNDDNSFAGNSQFTYNKVTDILTVGHISANASLLYDIIGANVNGTVGSATTAATVTTAAQPNITSTGTLTGLTVAGTTIVQSIVPSANITYDLGNNSNRFKDIYLSGTTIYLGDVQISTGAGGLSLPNANITTDIIVGGNATIAGNLTVSGTTEYTNVNNLYIKDPLIEIGGAANNQPLTTNDGKDRGELLHYYTTQPVDAFIGWDNSNGEFALGSNVSSTDNVVTFNTFGNLRAQHIYANINGSNVVGEVSYAATANAVAGANVSGVVANATFATTSGTTNSVDGANVNGAVAYASTANAVAGANVSGAVAYASTANAVAGANVSGEVSYAATANSVAGANVSGTVANATFATTSGATNSVDGANVSGAVAYATTANSVAGANVAGAVAYATTANSVAGANVSGVVANATFATTAGSASDPKLTNIIFATNEPTGFPDPARTQTTISFNNSTRTLSITPTGASFDVWVKGTQYTKSVAQTSQIANVTGLYYFYFDSTGTLQNSTIEFDLANVAPASYVSWSSVNVASSFLGDERHGTVMDWATLDYLHETTGSEYASGFAISGSTGGTGDSALDAQIGLSSGVFYDQDMRFSINAYTLPGQIPVVYRTDGEWTRDSATVYPYKFGTARAAYNQFTGGNWILTDIGNQKYGIMWIVATNDINTPIISIMGQQEYNGTSAAENASFGDLNLVGLPLTEFHPLFKLVFETATAMTNAVKVNQLTFQDFRTTSGSVVPVSTNAIDINFREVPENVFSSDPTANEAWNLVIGNRIGSYLPTNTANVAAGNILSDHLLYANGTPYVFTTNAAGSNTYVQFNDDNIFAGNVNFTFNKTTGTVAATNFSGNGALLTSLTGGNVVGAVAYATTANSVAGANVSGQVGNALVAGTVYTAAQANITSVGTLTGLNVSSSINATSFTSNIATGTAPFTVTSTTEVANLNVAQSNFANTANAVAGANVSGQVGNALVAGTVYTAAQPNITSTGTLTGLVSGGVVDFTTTSNVTLGAVANLHISGGTNGYVLSTNGTGGLNWVAQSGGGGTPGGNTTELQFNNAGTFGGIANVTFASGNFTLGPVANVKMSGGSSNLFVRTDGSGNLSFQAITSNLTVGTRSTAVNIGITNYTMNVEARTGNVTVNVN